MRELKDPSVAHSALRTGGSELFMKALINDPLPSSPLTLPFYLLLSFLQI